MPLRSLAWLTALLAALFLAAPAHAGCTPSSGLLTFTPASSYDVRATAVPTVSGSAGLACTGAALGLLNRTRAVATVTSLNGFTLVGPTGDAIQYRVSPDAAQKLSFNETPTIDYASDTLLSLLGLLGATSFTAPLHARPIAAANVAAGNYDDTLTINWDYEVCNGVQLLSLVCVGWEARKVTVTVAVRLVVGNDCRITAPDVQFGTAALVEQFATQSAAVMTDCTKGTAYRVAFTAGNTQGSRPWRAMTGPGGATLQYNLYRPDGVTIWDESNPQPAERLGTGSQTPVQAHGFVARINPAQPPRAPGSYSDDVSVVISF
ncbi:spore coat protein U domain-containing protein [uncultured Sphingomonas sp.]|uniref:Csu type fimbrial protein n=1 Tax=uncultured Sphingomonas sp. TaxID=158754 RepID=UPI00262F5108|nr:spore coat protein U domain-containing protein [uncultured Sphingomonas sp.]